MRESTVYCKKVGSRKRGADILISASINFIYSTYQYTQLLCQLYNSVIKNWRLFSGVDFFFFFEQIYSLKISKRVFEGFRGFWKFEMLGYQNVPFLSELKLFESVSLIFMYFLPFSLHIFEIIGKERSCRIVVIINIKSLRYFWVPSAITS